MWPFSSSSSNNPHPTTTTTTTTTSQMMSLEEKKVLRKIDWILMPLLTISFGLQYYDKVSHTSRSLSLTHTFIRRSLMRERKIVVSRGENTFSRYLTLTLFFSVEGVLTFRVRKGSIRISFNFRYH
jgi:hypothetical protein